MRRSSRVETIGILVSSLRLFVFPIWPYAEDFLDKLTKAEE
jgi:hypothetical protein